MKILLWVLVIMKLHPILLDLWIQSLPTAISKEKHTLQYLMDNI